MTKPTIIFLMAGQNNRFYPLNTLHHKGLIQLMGKPLIVQALENLEKHDFHQVVLVVSPDAYKDASIHQLFKQPSLSNLEITLVVQSEAGGQGNAILSAQEQINGDFIVVTPYYTNAGELATQLWESKQQKNADCVFMGSKTETPELFGIMQVDGERVKGVVEKPAAGTAPSNIRINSIYLFDQDFLKQLESVNQHQYSLEDACSTHAQQKNIIWVEQEIPLPTLKYPWHLFGIQALIFKQLESQTHSTATVASTALIDTTNGPVVIDEGAVIGHAAKIAGPCYVGKNTIVGDFSFVRGSCIEENAVVGAYTEVVRSIIQPGASIHHSYLADSILGKGTKIGVGLITANKRLDRQTIKVKVGEKRIDTLKNTLGMITGEKATLGIRVNVMPGIIIGPEATIFPNLNITKPVAANQLVSQPQT
jgi:UDP-N-acetylglucosamine diphosphorylase / glucose-1-phosphate thymidylyltransferase / UDP-N-acetylgalactosamine diphosphorylase / glucosamine-1-phosphate N-acetyltransferase / galactosamine-1-phosphate N-acetyltransferase